MILKEFRFCILVFGLGVFSANAQQKEAGPIIKDHGRVWKVDADMPVDPEKQYKVVFDIMDSPEDKTIKNATIETAARFLNMHARAGVPAENLKAVLVVHNEASKDLTTDQVYKDKYGAENPNSDLIRDLMNAGVQVIFCGQSSLSRGFPKQDLIPGVQLSLSAMTALITLQDEGYRLIKF